MNELINLGIILSIQGCVLIFIIYYSFFKKSGVESHREYAPIHDLMESGFYNK